MNLNHENIKKIRGLVVFTVLLIIGIYRYDIVWSVILFIVNLLLPLLIGAAIAFILNVPMHSIEEKLFSKERKARSKAARKLARPVSMLTTLILVIGVLVLVVSVVFPELANTFILLGQNITTFIPKVQAWAEGMFATNAEIMSIVNNLQFDWHSLIDGAVSFLQQGASNAFSGAFSAIGSIVSGFVIAFIAFFFAIYILIYKEKLDTQVKKLMKAFLPKKLMDSILEIGSLSYRTFAGYISGQVLDAVILGAMFFVVMSIIRLPYPLLISMLITVTAVIPLVGTFIGFFVGCFLILVVSPVQALIFAIVYIVLQQVESQFVFPRVVGNKVGMPAIFVLAAVSIGGTLAGLVGMIIFIPLFSVLYTLLRRTVNVRLNIRDERDAAHYDANVMKVQKKMLEGPWSVFARWRGGIGNEASQVDGPSVDSSLEDTNQQSESVHDVNQEDADKPE